LSRQERYLKGHYGAQENDGWELEDV
jgi:hypothetical protein